MSEKINWEKVDEKIIERISRNAETYLQEMLRAAASSDQRSATLGGIFITAGSAIAIGLLAYLATEEASEPLVAGGLVTALIFIVGSFFCLHATTPVSFYIAGNLPKSWNSTVRDGTGYKAALAGDLAWLGENIEENRAGMKSASRWLKWGIWLGMSAPVAGTLVTLFSYLF